MAVDLIAPTGSILDGPSVEFIWNSPDNQYCWDNYIYAQDAGGNIFSDSGAFNPNGGDSRFIITDIPSDGSLVSVFISCNPNHTQFLNYTTTNDSDTGTTTGSTTGGSTTAGTDGNININVDIPDTFEMELITGIDEEVKTVLLEGTISIFVIAIGFAFLFKVLR